LRGNIIIYQERERERERERRREEKRRELMMVESL
jgi:hypothetical protein